uniref:Uncharacterized protein n=1 Tax=Ailuropoda melanoleuca TaxID=9646 RepID=A0A7N5JXH0_AILME
MAEKKTRALQRGNRHSRFGGSYIVQGLKSIGERDLIFHKGLHNVSTLPIWGGNAVELRVPKEGKQGWGAWLPQSGEHATLDLRVVSLSPMLGVEMT